MMAHNVTCRKVATLQKNTGRAADIGTLQTIFCQNAILQLLKMVRYMYFLSISAENHPATSSLFLLLARCEVHSAFFGHLDAIFDSHCADKVHKASRVAPFIVVPRNKLDEVGVSMMPASASKTVEH